MLGKSCPATPIVLSMGFLILALPNRAKASESARQYIQSNNGRISAMSQAELREYATQMRRYAATTQNKAASALPLAPPTLTSGKIVTKSVNVLVPPASPLMTLKYSAPAGLYQVLATWTAPNGQQTYLSFFDTGGINYVSGTFPFSYTYSMSLYSQPGEWTLTELLLTDQAYNTTEYSGSELAKLFPSLTFSVKNKGTPDVKSPIASGGAILTPVVSVGTAPNFGASISASDDLSGYTVSELLLVGPNNLSAVIAYGAASTPTLNGSIIAGWNFSGFSSATGTWTIQSYTVCDAANNCLTDSNSADVQKLFGTTTFQLTN